MSKNIFLSILGLILGICFGLLLIYYYPISMQNTSMPQFSHVQLARSHQVVGFLPYWLLNRASPDYSQYITTLTYFALRIDKDGSILKLATPQQDEPGWYDLSSGGADQFLQNAKKNNINLSLTIDSGDNNTIDSFLTNSASSASTLVSQTVPIMNRFGFSDMNLDIEYTKDASDSARKDFVQFVQHVREFLPKQFSLTIEISPIDATSQRLIDIKNIAKYADNIILMAYDYHAPDSFVTGPIAPLNGAGTIAEYDVATAIEKTASLVNSTKIILGIPLYGYEWEILGTIPRTPVIPGSGTIASNRRAEEFLTGCATCSAQIDQDAQESYVVYQSADVNTNHIIFYPTSNSTSAKIDFVKNSGLGGIALWALGYEGNTILIPLVSYKNN